jgi:uncharacterized membrane protein YfcA
MVELSFVMIAGLAIVAGAVVQSSVGLGLGLVAAPVIALVDPGLMPGAMMVPAILLPLLTVRAEFTSVDWRGLGWTMPARLAGIAVGVWVVAVLPPDALGAGVGLMVLAGVALSLRSLKLSTTPGAPPRGRGGGRARGRGGPARGRGGGRARARAAAPARATATAIAMATARATAMGPAIAMATATATATAIATRRAMATATREGRGATESCDRPIAHCELHGEATDHGLEVVEVVHPVLDFGECHIVPGDRDPQCRLGFGSLAPGGFELRRTVVLARAISLCREQRRRGQRPA